jgi:hypothetical protein
MQAADECNIALDVDDSLLTIRVASTQTPESSNNSNSPGCSGRRGLAISTKRG